MLYLLAWVAWVLGFDGIAGTAAWLSNVQFVLTFFAIVIALPLMLVINRSQPLTQLTPRRNTWRIS